ncbi:TadE/TadG family type IV pilus assembly protein [Paenibacillus sp. CAU 1782]
MKRWLKDERGSFTLESTFVFPVLFAMVMLFIVFGCYLYQKTIVFYYASAIAERVAFSWDNSNRDPVTGLLAEPAYDPLYWRIGSNGVLGSLLKSGWQGESANVKLPEEIVMARDGEAGLGDRKLALAAESITAGGFTFRGEASVINAGLSRYVEVKLKKPMEMAPQQSGWTWDEPAGAGRSYLVDPAEFIRSVDLLRYYVQKFAGDSEQSGSGRDHAGKVLAPYRPEDR